MTINPVASEVSNCANSDNAGDGSCLIRVAGGHRGKVEEGTKVTNTCLLFASRRPTGLGTIPCPGRAQIQGLTEVMIYV